MTGALRRIAFGIITGGAVLAIGCQSLQTAVADGDTRTITMHHVHTGEDITITYKRDGAYDPAALKKLDWFLRDWREGKAIHMDPHLIDVIWEVYRDVGATQPIQVVCGYRDEHTNEMLRHRSSVSGVARYSQHMLGKAMDFFIPGVPLEKLRVAGLRLQRGGVGFYPSSGSPFVHLDVGGVRYWPRMPREQLARIFPDGRTVYLPADGRPLRNYALALADIRRRGSSAPSSLSLASAERAGMIDDASEPSNPPSLLARLFGFGENQNRPEQAAASKAKAGAQQPAASAKPVEVASTTTIPLPKMRPADAPMTVVATLPAAALAARPTKVAVASAQPTPSEIIRTRGYWVGAPDAPPSADDPLVLAAAHDDTTGSLPREWTQRPPATPAAMLAYAADEPYRTRVVTRWAAATSVATKAKAARRASPMRMLDPWLDAVIMTPSVRTYLSATRYGARELRSLQPLLDRPTRVIAMAFSQGEPSLPSDRFSGPAVVFVGTATFAPAETASLETAWLPQ